MSTRATSQWPRTSTSIASPVTPPALRAPTWPTSRTRRRSSPGAAHREFVAQTDFENAFERVVAGLQSRKVITDHEKRVVAWHEAGHALVSELLPTVDKVQKVSIVPRGKALGYTLNLPQEDRYLKSREELIDYMKVLLAGRVSEQITFGRDHHGRRRRPEAGHGHRAVDGLRVRDGHLDPLAPGSGRRLQRSPRPCVAPATRRCRRSPRRPIGARTACWSTTATSSTRSPSG